MILYDYQSDWTADAYAADMRFCQYFLRLQHLLLMRILDEILRHGFYLIWPTILFAT